MEVGGEAKQATQLWDKHTACSQVHPQQEPNPLPVSFHPVPGAQVPVAPSPPGWGLGEPEAAH